MANTIKVNRKDFIKQLSSITQPNVGIADVVIDRTRLLQALKLQTQPQADILTINYGKASWSYLYNHKAASYKWVGDGNGGMTQEMVKPDSWEYDPYTKEPEPCIQFSCDHTIMRFLNRPKVKYGEPEIKHLNFIDHEQPKPKLTGISLDSQELLRALSFVLPCVATAVDRPVLNCILLDSDNDVLKLAVADGFRLGVASIPAKGIPKDKVVVDPKELYTFLKGIKPIGKGKSKYYPEVYLNYHNNKVKFAYESGELELPHFNGNFPDYTQLIPAQGTHIEFIASQLLEATKALSTIAKDGSGIIRLQFQKGYPLGKILVTAKSEELGDSSVDCDAKVDSDCKIAVNTKYLIDLLKLCGDDSVDTFLTTPSSPMVFNNDDWQWVIMPMYVQW